MSLNFTLQLDVALARNESITVDLPGFKGADVMNAVCDGSAADWFRVSWRNETLTLQALHAIAALTQANLVVERSNGITLPGHTLERNDDSLRISTDAAAGRVVRDRLTSEHVIGA